MKKPRLAVIERLEKILRSWRRSLSGVDRKVLRSWRRFLPGGDQKGRRSLRFGDVARRRRRRRWIGVILALLASTLSAVYALQYAPDGSEDSLEAEYSAKGISEPIPEPSDDSPAAAAYRLVASRFSGMEPESIQGVYQSVLDPSWASVRLTVPEEESIYLLFLQLQDDGSWEAQRSIRADEPESPEYERVILSGVPEDLVEAIYPENLADDPSGLLTEIEEVGELPTVEAAEAPPPDPVAEDVPEAELERVEAGLEEVVEAVEDYEGVAGVYVRDPNGGYGYGVRPDETFFSASIIKVPIMIAVYRRIDEGQFSLSDSFETKSEDWAAGAGWLQWEEAGKYHTVEDYLYMMMTQSDNVATNALTRIAGGPEYVNEVARSLGATDTILYQKVTSERAAVFSLDNRTTPRDMTTMMEQIATETAASPESSQDMLDLMGQNTLESWLEDGLAKGTKVANKAGWLYRVYDETAVVWHEDRPYVVTILSQQGPEDPEEAKPLLKDISEAVWETQDS